MAKQYTPEQIDKILKTLPEELQEAIFSVETANTIWNVCEQYNIVDDRGGKIAEYVGYVLMGLILPADFQKVLEEEIGLSKKIAKEIAHEINRFIFYPVKPAIEKLHSMEIEVSAKVVTPKPGEQPEEQEPEQKPKGDDRYREEIE